MSEPGPRGRRVCVVGAGNGGQAMAADLALRGARVALYDVLPDPLAPLQRARGIRLRRGAETHLAQPELVTNSPGEALRDADLVMVVVPAHFHVPVVRTIAEHLGAAHTVILHTAAAGSALAVAALLRGRPAGGPRIAETDTLVFTCRKEDPESVTIFAEKRRVRLAAIPTVETSAVAGDLRALYPQFVSATSVLETSLANVNAVAHVPTVLLNAGQIELRAGRGHFWTECISDHVARMIDRLDAERLSVARAFGLAVPSYFQWLQETYGVAGNTLAERILANPAYRRVPMITGLRHRFLEEDVPMGLVPVAALARIAGVHTPLHALFVDLASTILDRDFWSAGRGIPEMGLEGMDREALLAFVTDGGRGA